MIKRKSVTEPITYQGRKIEVKHCGPDLLCYVDDLVKAENEKAA